MYRKFAFLNPHAEKWYTVSGTLFLIAIDKFAYIFERPTKVFLFVDDILFFVLSKSISFIEWKMQETLNRAKE